MSLLNHTNSCLSSDTVFNDGNNKSSYKLGAIAFTFISVSTLSLTNVESLSSNCQNIETNYQVINSSLLVSLNEKIKKLKKLFLFKNQTELDSFFLQQNEDVIDLLSEAWVELSSRFYTTPIELELVKDWEIDEWDTLYISVNSPFEQAKSRLLMNDFLKNWAFHQPKELKRLVTFSLS